MINEVDEALRTLVKTDVVNGTDVEILFDAPTRDWASRRNTPSIDLYLYDLREDTKRRSAGTYEHRDDRGMVTQRQALPRYFKLAYLITAWTQRPEDEHRLLSAILACFMRYEVLPAFALTPMLAETGYPLAVQIAYPPPEDRQVSDVWSSVGGDLKPSVDLVITLPIQPDKFFDIAQAVMAPMRLRSVGHTTMDMEDDLKQGRVNGAAGQDGNDAPTAPSPAAEADTGAAAETKAPGAPVGGQQAAIPQEPTPLRTVTAEVMTAGESERDGAVDPSASYLLARLRLIEHRVRALVAHRRADDPAPDDPFRGLYLSDEHVDRVLAADPASRVIEWGDDDQRRSLEQDADDFEAGGTPIRLRALARLAGLGELEVDLLLLSLAPDLDSRFERLYGYLNDDVTRRRATIGLGLELCGASPWWAEARGVLSAEAPLLTADLLVVEEPERPYLTRSLRVPDRLAAHLLGDDRPDPTVAELLRPDVTLPAHDGVHPLAAAIAQGAELVYLRERLGSSTPALAAAALREAGLPALVVDLDHLGSAADVAAVAKLVGREALLIGAGVVAGPLEAVLDRGRVAIRALAELPRPVLLHGRAGWEPSWSRRVPLTVETTAATTSERLGQWEASLGSQAPADLVGADVTSQFLLSAEQVARAAGAARLQASFTGQDVNVEHLRAGARAQNGAGLERLARRIQPGVGWDDLVLAPTTQDALRELASRARQRDLVLDDWGMRPGGGRGRGITVLFGGDSGTGKTMSAEVVAHDLGLDLYTVNLATVVDKYVGETEKNLERIFTEADGVNAVLLFDEADALFGKRSEVKDANDRYANIEVAYLLQRMETFDGLAILATNLRANVDDAFARRLDMVVDFPVPDADQRLALWDRCLAAGVPRAPGLDLAFCAQAFELSGGNIRSIAITAAYLAADSGRPVSMGDLINAIQREYRKLGRLVVSSEFGSYYSLIGADDRKD